MALDRLDTDAPSQNREFIPFSHRYLYDRSTADGRVGAALYRFEAVARRSVKIVGSASRSFESLSYTCLR
jgi:hypothetical protein